MDMIQAAKALNLLKSDNGLSGFAAKLVKTVEERKAKISVLQGEVAAFELVKKIVDEMILKSGLESVDLTPAPTSSLQPRTCVPGTKPVDRVPVTDSVVEPVMRSSSAPVCGSSSSLAKDEAVDPINEEKERRRLEGLCTFRARGGKWCVKKLRSKAQKESGRCKEHSC